MSSINEIDTNFGESKDIEPIIDVSVTLKF